jgi:release factor glutamine methyltransferase
MSHSSSGAEPAGAAPAQASPLDLTAVAARLRAAGCVFAEDEARLIIDAARSPAELAALVERRVTGMPLEHVVGWAEFCGLRVRVDPGVFVPRPRTELLVRETVAVTATGAIVVDLACGSGAIGLAVAVRVPGIELHAVDIELAAVRCARGNLVTVGGQVHEGNLYDPLPDRLRGQVNVLVANVPYVPSHAIALMPPEAREYEPLVALDGGADGLDVLRLAAASAADWLAPGGHLLMETSTEQAPAALGALTAAGLTAAVATDEDLGATVVRGRR